MSTTQRLSSLLVTTLFFVLIALMATFGVRSADAAQGPPAAPESRNRFKPKAPPAALSSARSVKAATI